jgi:hypothetical protein
VETDALDAAIQSKEVEAGALDAKIASLEDIHVSC